MICCRHSKKGRAVASAQGQGEAEQDGQQGVGRGGGDASLLAVVRQAPRGQRRVVAVRYKEQLVTLCAPRGLDRGAASGVPRVVRVDCAGDGRLAAPRRWGQARALHHPVALAARALARRAGVWRDSLRRGAPLPKRAAAPASPTLLSPKLSVCSVLLVLRPSAIAVAPASPTPLSPRSSFTRSGSLSRSRASTACPSSLPSPRHSSTATV